MWSQVSRHGKGVLNFLRFNEPMLYVAESCAASTVRRSDLVLPSRARARPHIATDKASIRAIILQHLTP